MDVWGTMKHDSTGHLETFQGAPSKFINRQIFYNYFCFCSSMVRNRQRKTNKGSFLENDMRDAVDLVSQGHSIRKAAELKNVNHVTLSRYVKKKNDNQGDTNLKYVPHYNVRQVFNLEQENKMREYLLMCSKMFYGLPVAECKKVAYEMAVINKIKYPSSWDAKKSAGQDWFYGFLKRNPSLSQRTPEGCSLSRATSFTRANVEVFFDHLQEVYKNPHFADGTRVFNLDETGTCTVQKPQKIIAEKGAKQVSKCTSAEKGTNVTTCCFISASGNFLPPVMIFPRVHFKPHMTQEAPTGTLGLANPSGWMTSVLFVDVIKHFIHHSKSSIQSPTLILCDNHESHLSLEVLNLCKENGVTMLTFPPHSTNKLQPLDVGVFKPFKTYYNAAIDTWMMQHPGQTATIYNVAGFVKIAHERGMTSSNITAAFKKTGIYPYDRHVFTDADYLCNYVTDRPMADLPATCSQVNEDPPSGDVPAEKTNNSTMETNGDANLSSFNNNSQDPSTSTTSSNVETSLCGPEDFRGFPKAGSRKNNRKGRAKGKSMIATSTPEMTAIANKTQPSTAKRDTVKRKITDYDKNTKKKPKKIEEVQSSSEEEEDVVNYIETDDDLDVDEEIFILNEDKFIDLDRSPITGDYVLVEYKLKCQNTKFYVGLIMKEKDTNRDYEVKFFRIKGHNTFVEPPVPDVSVVAENSIKMILENPVFAGSTQRQKQFISFGIDFTNINIG